MKKSKITDFDPESLLDPAPSSSSDEQTDADISDAEDVNAGREHYATVGKSKLRQKADVPAAPSYKGRAISRNELEDSDSDDPFAKGFDDEDSEDDDDDDDVQHGMDGLEINGEDESNEEAMDDDEEMDSEDEDEQDEDASGSSEEESGEETNPDASAVRNLLQDTKSFTSTLAAGAQSDVAKGQAVKTQRKTFDTLLNTRIRLQKALISTNSMAADKHKEATAQSSSIEAAEMAALKLLNNLTDLRLTLEDSRTGMKRKRPSFNSSTSSSEIWSFISAPEKTAVPHRKAVLERWSTKTRATTVTNVKNRLNASATQTLTEVLDGQLSTNSEHLITRTHIPRSCAPIQSNASNKGSAPIPEIYDDADFYGLMLKELLEQRSADSASGGAAEFVVAAPWQVAREAKTKKIVDTKASKGRRLRYTVQEKLQNFMAPEERGDWSARQRDELFSSLFGQRVALGEHDDVESEGDENGEGLDAQEAGLMLFRS